jgi:hypothetical protein
MQVTDEWIIQRFIRLARPGEDEHLYEPLPGDATGMTKEATVTALEECGRRCPNDEFRAHRVRAHEQRADEAIARARESWGAQE